MTDILKAICAQPEPRKWEPEASMADILEWVAPKRVPVVVHPAAFRERWSLGKNGAKKYGPGSPPRRDEWEAAGAEIILAEGPYKLYQGCWTTGTVPRLSFERAGRSSRRAYREGTEFLPDDLEDDQAVVINVKEKGLVILAGGSMRLADLFERSAQQMRAKSYRGGEAGDISIVFEERDRRAGGQEAPQVGLSWEGGELTFRRPADTLASVSEDKLEQAGRALMLALMILGRETQY